MAYDQGHKGWFRNKVTKPNSNVRHHYLEIDMQKGWNTMEQNRATQFMAQGYV